jgi:diguanylate cyclase (GGDEF)-like protein
MSIEKILTGMNIPGTIVHINGTVNVYHFSSALRRIRGIEDGASYEELAHEVLAIQDDPSYARIELGDRRFLFVPRELSDVMAVYTASIRDELTKAYNRRGLYAQYEQLRARVGDEGVTIVLCLDANKFKEVNDKYGHDVGDKVLIAMTQRLRRVLKHEDLVARIGGDEFVAVAWMPNRETVEQFKRERLPEINTAVCRDYAINDGRVTLPLSFALGLVVHEGTLPPLIDDLINQADRLMYADKGAAAR